MLYFQERLRNYNFLTFKVLIIFQSLRSVVWCIDQWSNSGDSVHWSVSLDYVTVPLPRHHEQVNP